MDAEDFRLREGVRHVESGAAYGQGHGPAAAAEIRGHEGIEFAAGVVG